MSYILDALRRADAEREREAGAVPTLRTPARPVMEHEDDAAFARGARPAWLLPAAGAGLLLAGAAVYALLGTPSPAPPAPPAGLSSGVAVPMPMPMPALPGAPGPAGTPSTALPMPMPMPKPLPPPGAASPAPRATVTPPPKPAGLPGTTAKAPVGSPAAAAAPVARPTAAPGVAASAPTTAKRALKLAELPDALRRELPPLAVAGSMHSPERAGRMLILNGQVRREGDAVAPGLVLEEIGAKSAIFGFKGQRIEIPL